MKRSDVLTNKEKRGLYYLLKYPVETDKALTEITKLKLSTVTAIRRRLRNLELYRGVNTALLTNLGVELLVVHYGTLNRIPKGVGAEFYKNVDLNAFYMCTDGICDLAVGYEKNYASATNTMNNFLMQCRKNDLSVKNWHTVVFPAENTYILNFFEYAPVIKYLFNLEVGESERKISPKLLHTESDSMEFTKKERIGYTGLLTVSEGTDVDVSVKTKLSRQAVAAMRKRFADKVLLPRRVLNLGKLGLEMLVLTHDKLNLGISLEKKVNVATEAITDLPVFFGVISNSDAIYLSAYRNYADYVAHERARVEQISKGNAQMLEATASYTYSVSNLTMLRDHAFLDVATKTLNLQKI